MKNLQDCYVYALTPPTIEFEDIFLSKIKDSLEGGIDMLQLRLKAGNDRQKLAMGRQIRQLTRKKGTLFVVNDRLDFCQILHADGLHLGQEDVPLGEARKILGRRKIIGLSTHTLSQVYEAEKAGADYIGYGPCYPTDTKKDVSPRVKLEEIAELRQHLKIPFFLIGGLSTENLGPLLRVGANRVAICAAIYKSDHVRESILQIRRMLNLNFSLPSACT